MSRDDAYKTARTMWLGKNANSHMKDCYDEGYMQAISDYGIWKDGTRVIGCMETSVLEIIESIKDLDNTE
jgi:hypothetical protein